MAISRTIPELVMAIREAADITGQSYKERFPDTLLAQFAMRAVNAFWRLGNDGGPQAEIGYSTATKTTASGTSSYPLASFTPAVTDMMHLVLVELEADGRKVKLNSYEHDDHPLLSDSNLGYSGIPIGFRLIGTSMSLLPTPQGSYTLTITYVPTLTQLGSAPTTYDTMAGLLDEWVTRFGAREVALKQKWWDLYKVMDTELGRLDGDVRAEFRKRNRNNPPEIRDDRQYDRFGRRVS